MEKPLDSIRDAIKVQVTSGTDSRMNDRVRKAYESIDSLHKQDLDASKTSDIDLLISLFTEDCIMLPPGSGPVCGHDSIRSYLTDKCQECRKYNVAKYDQHFEEIKVMDDLAYEWGTIKGVYYMKTGGPDIFENSRLFRILRRQPDDSWKIARVMWHDVP